MLPIGQALWLKELESYKEFPPMQDPASYNLDQVLEADQEGECQGRERLAADTSVMRRQRAPHDGAPANCDQTRSSNPSFRTPRRAACKRAHRIVQGSYARRRNMVMFQVSR